MHAAMQAYREIGYAGPARPDHVPTLEGEDGDAAGRGQLCKGHRCESVSHLKNGGPAEERAGPP